MSRLRSLVTPHRDRPLLDRDNLLRVSAAAAGVVGLVQAGAATVAVRTGRRDAADVVWGPGLAAVAVSSALVGSGDPVRRWTLAGLTSAWATRLGRLIVQRVAGSDEEDPRYTEFLEGDPVPVVIGKVFLTQGLAQLLVSAPLQVAAATRLPDSARRWLFPAGVAVMAGGAVVEALADRQKAQYQERDDEDKPDVLDTGLWAWSRHPNYFGDSCVWAGAWLASAASPPAGLTAPAPIAMAYLLVYATGAKRTEKRMEKREAYRDYQRRVAFFLPRPPKS
ncbi:DUF1295 domain-containing protein [Nocardioides mangrovicus]|uniref:DUF1295 domain-containing protein n=1 Tax=Nocardioides mangrovicus TaxID=2478913 RepID=UPI001313E552|nr:DUF1295 domain-containing protein [Nocardioides mangrovicus]